MAARVSHRYRIAVTAIVAVAAVALAGCGAKHPAATATSPGTGSTAPDGSGGLNTLDTSPGPSIPPTTANPPTGSPGYPGDARGYAQAALDAWTGGAHTYLVALTSPAAASGFDHITGHPDGHWHFHTCEGAAGSQYCTWDNNNGDRLRIKVIAQYVGQAHAIDEVVLDVTTYPAGADAYVNGFMQAWLDANTYRMSALSGTTVTSYFTHYTPQTQWTVSSAGGGAAGTTYVKITNSAGFAQTVGVTNQYLGQPHAITRACPGTTGCA